MVNSAGKRIFFGRTGKQYNHDSYQGCYSYRGDGMLSIQLTAVLVIVKLNLCKNILFF
jgi:hypothetical protein